MKGYINDICPGDGTHGLCHELKRDFDFKTRVFENVSQVAVIAKEIRLSENGIAEAYGDCDGLIIFMSGGYGDACAP